MRWPWQDRHDEKSAGGPLVALAQLAAPRWGSRSPMALARDGYAGNPVAYRCIRMIAEAAASVPLDTGDGALSQLLESPAPGIDGRSLLEAFYSNLQIAGNAYVEAAQLADDEPPGALFVLRPERMKAVTGYHGWIEGWTYDVGHGRRTISRSSDGWLPVLQLKLFNPLDDVLGLAPLAAARRSLDLHNSGADWQKALIDNSARPSGALVYGRDGSRMSDEQFDRLKGELESAHTGAANAGRPLLLEGGLDWKPMSLSPADMDFLEARHAAAREIALAFGVPPMLLGIPGDNTYSNYREANGAFWKMTVLPLAEKMAAALTTWLGPRFGGAEVRALAGCVPALAAERAETWTHIDAVSFLSVEEKRALAGPLPEAGGRS